MPTHHKCLSIQSQNKSSIQATKLDSNNWKSVDIQGVSKYCTHLSVSLFLSLKAIFSKFLGLFLLKLEQSSRQVTSTPTVSIFLPTKFPKHEEGFSTTICQQDGAKPHQANLDMVFWSRMLALKVRQGDSWAPTG